MARHWATGSLHEGSVIDPQNPGAAVRVLSILVQKLRARAAECLGESCTALSGQGSWSDRRALLHPRVCFHVTHGEPLEKPTQGTLGKGGREVPVHAGNLGGICRGPAGHQEGSYRQQTAPKRRPSGPCRDHTSVPELSERLYQILH